ncbi:MAG: hypothetical protein AAF078_09850 [Planctomycetota bacterium]
MYTVTCPSCGYAIELGFARVGAAGRCPSCSRIVPVDESTLRRPGQTPRPQVPEPDKLQPDLPRLDADGNPIGLSGLSHLLDQSAPRPVSAAGKADAPAADVLKPPRRRTATPPPPPSRQLLIFAVVAVATVALVGFAIWYITAPSSPRVPVAPEAPPAEAPSAMLAPTTAHPAESVERS